MESGNNNFIPMGYFSLALNEILACWESLRRFARAAAAREADVGGFFDFFVVVAAGFLGESGEAVRGEAVRGEAATVAFGVRTAGVRAAAAAGRAAAVLLEKTMINASSCQRVAPWWWGDETKKVSGGGVGCITACMWTK
jgi:hypothetical protein